MKKIMRLINFCEVAVNYNGFTENGWKTYCRLLTDAKEEINTLSPKKEENVFHIMEEIKGGGKWLGAARGWMQSNIRKGDTLCWSSTELVSIPFYKFEEFAKIVAANAILEDRNKH